MAKIAIVTNYRFGSYGSVLQSYALQNTIRNLGHECENLQYNRRKKQRPPFSPWRRALYRIRSVAQRPAKLIEKPLKKGIYGRMAAFERFFRECLSENPVLYNSITELKSTNTLYDAFICGSDQIWAPNLFDEWYYLSFVDEAHRRIAYAPSIGLPVIPDYLKGVMARLVANIEFLSVRERQGAEIIKDLTGRNVPVVLDPTLLVERDTWVKCATPVAVPDKYILCYFLGGNPEHRRIVETHREKSRQQLVVLPFAPCDRGWGDIILSSAGTTDFLGLVQNASIVFTDSYHGTIFSINLEKEFFTFARFREEDVLCQNSRVKHILQVLRLPDRLVANEGDPLPHTDPIDYADIRVTLQELRHTSLAYLRTSLEKSLSRKWAPKTT